jgi:murein L,D-transpeptidase YcbB/YkuD
MLPRNIKILILFFAFSKIVVAQTTNAENIMEQKIAVTNKNKQVTADGIVLFSQRELPKFYQNRNFELAWKDKKNRDDLLISISAAEEEGLNPQDYHLKRIASLFQIADYKRLEDDKKVDLDLLFTDALILYANHLISGKVEQSDLRSEWEVSLNERPKNIDSLITVTLNQNQIRAKLNALKPKTYLYEYLKVGLKDFKEILNNGGWPEIPQGETLKIGMKDARILKIREYLQINKILSSEKTENDSIFDKPLEDAVKVFQERHNLNTDGAIGAGTLEQMNFSVGQRIDQIRVNLERSRWVLNDLADDFLLVNIAGFYIKRIKNGKPIFSSRVIVGSEHRQSPIFKGKVQFVILNPTWTLPYSIATHETLPKIKKDPNYLSRNHMEIMDKNGSILNPGNINFNDYSSRNFPFIVRQKAGPWNALGQVKFMFPNKYSVYLHDTDSRILFDRQDRDLSHGCIRLEDKWGLFFSLTDEPEVWNQDTLDEILKSGKTTRVDLKNPIDIYILYWTAGVDTDKNIYFERDVYNRDPAVLKAINEPVKFIEAK